LHCLFTKWTVSALIFGLFTGCAAQNSKPSTAELLPEIRAGKAVLVVYRKAAKPGHFAVENRIGNQSLGKLHNEEFNWIHLDPGEYTLHTRWPEGALIPATERTLTIDAEKYYLVETRGGVGVAVLFKRREFKPTSTSLKIGGYSEAVKWLNNCCRLVKTE